jgi:rhamnogalacturonan acetylesterase
MNKNNLFLVSLLLLVLFAVLTSFEKTKPTVYLIGDSTVDDGSGNKGLWGWGKFLPRFFDLSKIDIKNYAQGGTSARTFQTNGVWDKKINKRGMWDTVYSKLRKGDYLIIQFGLNDQGKIDDTLRARGTIYGIGKDSVAIYNAVTKRNEVVHSFGWYMSQFIRQAKSKGVSVIVCSSVPKSVWKEGKLIRNEMGFGEWALQTAKLEKALSIDLNKLIADVYDKEGEKAVNEKYHVLPDNTHTTEAGAILSVSLVVKGISDLKNCRLKDHLKK